VEKVVRLINWEGKDRILTSQYISSDDSLDVRHLECTGYYWCDSTIFDIFTIPLVQGDPHTVLRDPHSCVISETVARKFFGDKDPVSVIFRIFEVDPDLNSDRKSCFLDYHETMAAKLCLPYRDLLVDLCAGYTVRPVYHFCHGYLAIHKNGLDQPG
jgi:hypothetical protein